MKNDLNHPFGKEGSGLFSPCLFCLAVVIACLSAKGQAQINSGSDGHDGAFNPATSITINMADHPDGIYQYTSVNIPANVTVMFIPNANNTPVVWLVQGDVNISGYINIVGNNAETSSNSGAMGGPGGFRGGNGGANPTMGGGPGGGSVTEPAAAFGSLPYSYDSNNVTHAHTNGSRLYGNDCLLPLVGGSGGGGVNLGGGGGGGGGAILIVSSQSIVVNGYINAGGGAGGGRCDGGGSGGAIRLVANNISGKGCIWADGGPGQWYLPNLIHGGKGRIRFDTYENKFGPNIDGVFSQGFQPIIFQSTNQLTQLYVKSIGGMAVSPSPTGHLLTPDAILSAQQNNPIPVVLQCVNIPLNTPITVSVKPANSAVVSATGVNNQGTLASSTATVLLNIPRGGGIMYATAVTGN